MGKGVAVRFVICGVVFFGLTKVALSFAQGHPPQTPQDLQVRDIAIPATVGFITETHQPTAAQQNPPIIVHIQEAHTNVESQQNIISILEQLVKEYGLKLILVEGGSGDVGLAYLRQYGPLEHRKQVAEKYLKAGLISAEEYLDVISDFPLILWGVEDQSLYQKNVDVFLGTQELRESLQPVLQSVRQAVELLRPKLLDPALNELEAQAKAFERQELSLSDYAAALEQAASRHGVGVSDGHPNLERFLSVRTLERTIQREQVQREQRLLIASLSTVLPHQSVDALLEKAGQMKSGTASAAEFYATLEHTATEGHVDLSTYPQLARYIRYVTQSAQVSAAVLGDELDDVTTLLRTRLTSTAEGRQLSGMLDTLELLEKMINFDLSPEEYRRLLGRSLQGLRADWETFLNNQLQRAGLPPKSFAGLERLEQRLPDFRRFYDVAHSRDEALVANAVKKLYDTGERLAVLITGGFHAPRISGMLKDRGVATLVLIPKVSRATDERLYRAVVRYKSGQGGSFEEVMDIANQSGTSTGR